MVSEIYVNTLKPGDVFRDWLIDVVGDKLHNKRCKVRVYRVPASHTVCKNEFVNEGYGVFAKFMLSPEEETGNTTLARLWITNSKSSSWRISS
jgi:archaeosine-15-forming tRNA-guanine transglycosylase